MGILSNKTAIMRHPFFRHAMVKAHFVSDAAKSLLACNITAIDADAPAGERGQQ